MHSKFFFAITLVLSSTICSAGDGAKLYNEFLDSGAFYDDEEWQQYVQTLGDRLLGYSSDFRRDYYFFVVDDPQVNAYALSDGYIYVNRGLLLYLESEDQLAAVIGHEIGHVVADHHGKRATTDFLGRAAGIAGAMVTGRYELMELSHATTMALIAGYGRENELEADQIGANLIARAGYNPLALLEVLQVLKDQSLFAKEVLGERGSYHGLFSTHPRSDKRLHDIVRYAQAHLPNRINRSVADFWEMMDGLRYGTEAMVGLLTPRKFFDKSLRLIIEFPPMYRVGFDSQQVAGVHVRGDDVGVIRVTRHVSVEPVILKNWVRNTLRRRDITSDQEINVDGRDVYIAELSTEGTKRRLSLFGAFYHGKDIFTVRGDSGKVGVPEDFREEFEAVIKGIRDLVPEDIQDEDTIAKIRLITAKPNDTYEQLGESSALPSYPTESLRLLNGDYPTGEPRAGDLVKIVQ